MQKSWRSWYYIPASLTHDLNSPFGYRMWWFRKMVDWITHVRDPTRVGTASHAGNIRERLLDIPYNLRKDCYKSIAVSSLHTPFCSDHRFYRKTRIGGLQDQECIPCTKQTPSSEVQCVYLFFSPVFPQTSVCQQSQ